MYPIPLLLLLLLPSCHALLTYTLHNTTYTYQAPTYAYITPALTYYTCTGNVTVVTWMTCDDVPMQGLDGRIVLVDSKCDVM